MNIDSIKVSKEAFERLPERLRFNAKIAAYYLFYADEFAPDGKKDSLFEGKSERLLNCTKTLEIDYYKKQNIKSIEKINLCRDKFCVNCQSVLAQARERKFAPVFRRFAEKKSIWHCIFTVKNCSGTLLRPTIKRMFSSFANFIRYFDRRSKIKGLDFGYFGFNAAIRSLEVTYNAEEKTYHPHLHCLMSFDKDLNLNKVYRNKFSYSYAHNEIKNFSSEENLFQRIWYLLNNGQKVTLSNIEALDLGYSVVFNKAEPEDFKEIFKYPFKGDLNKDVCLDYEQFKVYYDALKGLRVVQGYGDLLDYDFDDASISQEDLDIAWQQLKLEWKKIERPERIYEDQHTVLDHIKRNKCFYVTSGSYNKFLFNDPEFMKQKTEKRLTENSKDVLNRFNKENF